MKTLLQELWSRLKTLLWATFWVALTFLVDNLSQLLVGVSLPNIVTTFGGVLPTPVTINTAVVAGLIVNQISKFVHNNRAGKVAM